MYKINKIPCYVFIPDDDPKGLKHATLLKANIDCIMKYIWPKVSSSFSLWNTMGWLLQKKGRDNEKLPVTKCCISVTSQGSWFCDSVFLGHSQNCEKQQLHHVCPSVRMEQLGFHWMDFHEIWNLSIFQKSVKKIQVSLQLDMNKG